MQNSVHTLALHTRPAFSNSSKTQPADRATVKNLHCQEGPSMGPPLLYATLFAICSLQPMLAMLTTSVLN